MKITSGSHVATVQLTTSQLPAAKAPITHQGSNATKLPQTGDSHAILSLIVGILSAMLGLALTRKKREY